MNGQPHRGIPAVGCRQQGIGRAEGVPGQGVGDGAGIPPGHRLQGMGQDIEACIGNEAPGQLRQKLAVQNGPLGPEALTDQGVLHFIMGHNGKIRHLRSRTGGGGDGCQGNLLAGKIHHGFGRIHGAAAPQGHHQVRMKGLQPGRAPGHQFCRGVWDHLIENLVSFPQCLGNFQGCAFL